MHVNGFLTRRERSTLMVRHVYITPIVRVVYLTLHVGN
jgi:hypothetical protein